MGCMVSGVRQALFATQTTSASTMMGEEKRTLSLRTSPGMRVSNTVGGYGSSHWDLKLHSALAPSQTIADLK